jgi:hypothetical protein
MEKQKYDRIKILCILTLVFLVVPLTASAMRPFPYGAPTLYQQNNTSYIGPYYSPAPYGDSGDSEVVCGLYGCYWNEATAYLPKLVIAEQAW